MSIMLRLWIAATFTIFVAQPAPAQEPARPDLVLTGTIDATAHQSYREIPFRVPEGVTAITVEFDYSGQDARTVIDLGLADPVRFRGASGGNKRRFTLAESYATPSYLPGPIVPGTWTLQLGIANVRTGNSARYTARIGFARAGDPPGGFTEAPLVSEARWYRGDLHAHSAHSDGSCASQSGKRVPCPLHKTVEAAAARGLDFVALTEHNATSHHNAMLELQPFYDKLLLVPGRELTTFFGHANLIGATGPLDYRSTDINALLAGAAATGGLVSINHPAAPSGELCMGCGWTAPATDWTRVQAIEIVNGGLVAALGGAVETPLAGIAFWHHLLGKGHRLTAIAGSDTHDPTRNAPGVPATVVFARNLSVPALLEGIRSGRVFIDIEGSRDRFLDISATAGAATAEMGGTLVVRSGDAVEVIVRVAGVEGGRIEIVRDGAIVAIPPGNPLPAIETIRRIPLGPATPGWVRANLRGADGKLLLIGNPITLVVR